MKAVRFVLTKKDGTTENIHCIMEKLLPGYRKMITEMEDVLEYDEEVIKIPDEDVEIQLQ